MIVSGGHWVIATLIAVGVHLAGMLWLSIASPEPQRDIESASEGIVVTLGREARDAAESPDAPETAADAAVTAEAEAPEPDAAPEGQATEQAEPEVPAAPEPDSEAAPAAASPEPGQPDAAPAMAPDSPEPVEPGRLDEAPAVNPESAGTSGVPEPTAVEPEAAASSTAPPRATAGAAAGPAEAPTPPVADTDAGPETVGDPAPQAAVDDAPTPGPPGGEAAAQAPAAPEAAPEASRPNSAAPADDVAPTPAAQPPSRSARDTGPRSGPVVDIEVAVAGQPAPDVQPLYDDPATAEAAAPETVRLQDLQERSGGSGVVARYAGELKGWLQRSMHYPRAARLAGQEGEVVVRFVIDRDGNVQSVELESGSGFPILDREATEMVERGDPFPAIPEDMPGERLEVRVPVSFDVGGQEETRKLPPIELQ